MTPPIICYKCLRVVDEKELLPASNIKGVSKESAAKFKQCPRCKGRVFI